MRVENSGGKIGGKPLNSGGRVRIHGDDLFMGHGIRRIASCCKHVGLGKVGVVVQNGRDRLPGPQLPQDALNRNACALNNRLPEHDVGVGGDAFVRHGTGASGTLLTVDDRYARPLGFVRHGADVWQKTVRCFLRTQQRRWGFSGGKWGFCGRCFLCCL